VAVASSQVVVAELAAATHLVFDLVVDIGIPTVSAGTVALKPGWLNLVLADTHPAGT
jgi:hypothetical protein